MALQRITFDVDGDKQLSRAFDATAREVDDMTVPLSEFGAHLIRTVGEQFLTDGAHGGTPWPALSRAYAAWKDEHYPGRPMLVRTGHMRAAALSPDAVTVTPRRLVYEIDDDKAGLHQKGRGHLPVRKLVALGKDDRRQVDRIFAGWLNGIRRGQFAGPNVA